MNLESIDLYCVYYDGKVKTYESFDVANVVARICGGTLFTVYLGTADLRFYDGPLAQSAEAIA